MNRRRLHLSVTTGLALVGAAWPSVLRAEAPVISNLSPRGAQRGQKVVLVVEGANLSANPELILSLAAPRTLLGADPYKPTPGRVAFEFQVQETDAPGPYPLRLRTEEGLSNPVLFLVGVFPELSEAEPNDLFEAAQPIQYPVTINGALGPADRDTFKFSARAGQSLTFEVEARRIGSAVDPTLHLLARNGREIAMSDDARGLNVDSRIEATFPQDGEYLIQVHDATFQTPSPGFYRLKVGPIAYAEGVFPMGGLRGSELLVSFEGGTLGQKVLERVRLDTAPPENLLAVALPPAADTSGALPFPLRVGELPEVLEAPRAKADDPQSFPAPSTMNGRLERPGESDRYALEVKAGERWLFEVEAQSLGSFLDAVLLVANGEGARLASADDNGPSADPRLEFTVPEGVKKLVLSIEDLHHRGGPGFAYRLTARANRPEFLLNLATPTVNLPQKGTELVAVDVVRRGYNGPVRLEAVGLLPGFTVRGGLVPAGQAKGYLSISAPAGGKLEVLDVLIRGVGEGDVPPALAQATTFLAADRGIPVSPLRSGGLWAALVRPLPLVIRAEEGPVQVVLGHGRPVKVQAFRGEGAVGPIKLQGVFAPGGVTAAEGTIAEKADEGTLAFNAAPNAPLGEGEAAVRAVVKVGGKDVTVTAPIFSARVVPPFAPELAKLAVEGPLGGTTVLEGRIRREPPFAGAVEVKVEGLPAGATAPVVVVQAAESEFKISLASADPAKPGKLDLKAVASTKLGDPKNPTVYAAPALPFSYAVLPPAAATPAKPTAAPK